MPNHVSHRVIVKGPKEQLGWLLNYFTEDTLDFQKIIPMPGILFGTRSPHSKDSFKNRMALDLTGYTDWYEWAKQNWETKWGAYQGAIVRKPEGISAFFDSTNVEISELEFVFQTAWSVPVPILNKLAEWHPDCEFHLMSFDEGWCFGIDKVFSGTFELTDSEQSHGHGATDELYEKVYGHPYERDEEVEVEESPIP